MADCSIVSLFSGSGGNAYLYTCGDTRILIDCGGSARAIVTALAACGTTPAGLGAIFITHEHSDHTKALRVLLKKDPVPVHIPAPCYEVLTAEGTIRAGEPFIPHPPLYSVKVGAFSVSSFETSHDSVCCVGYRITAEGEDGTKRSFVHATDTGCVTESLCEALVGAEAAVLEANHDENMLLIGSYPYEIKRRILSAEGHLSNTDCAALAAQAARGGTRAVLLAHLSEENNYPALAEETVMHAIRTAGCDCRVLTAMPKTPVTLL